MNCIDLSKCWARRGRSPFLVADWSSFIFFLGMVIMVMVMMVTMMMAVMRAAQTSVVSSCRAPSCRRSRSMIREENLLSLSPGGGGEDG